MATREDEVIQMHDVEQEALIHEEPTEAPPRSATAQAVAREAASHPEAIDHPELIEIEALIKRIQAKGKDKLDGTLINEDIFKKIRESLVVIIKSMEKNPSMLSRAADFWGELPLWQKIMGGLTVTVPTLILGLVANVGFLLALCGITTLAYAGGGIMLDDHHNHTVNITDSLTKGVLGLTNLLEMTITALDKIRQQLAEQVEKFSQENTTLHNNNEKLTEALTLLNIKILATEAVVESLTQTKESLELAITFLKEQMQEKIRLLSNNQQQLQQITEDYQASQQRLESKIAEFALMKSKFELDLEKMKKTALTLQDTVDHLVETVIVGEKQQEEFKGRLDSFFDTEGKKFNSIAERIGETEQKLAVSEVKLKQNNVEYQSQLQELRQQIERLTLLADRRQQQIENGDTIPTEVLVNALQKRGFFAIKKSLEEVATNPLEIHANSPLVIS
ncbi:hypothetical protein ACD661_08410 [Legionella lytica]|uniref:Inclusion membrane protein A n=1 Tax=Legionella lytica TaxID=96232 RepID=A0ABW8D798_9GAMM